MSGLLDGLRDPVLAGFLSASVRLAIPILLAALGGMFSERAGVLNIGLEGMMLVGCFVGFLVAHGTGSNWLGVGAAILAGATTGLVLATYAVGLCANQVVVGISINLAMVGITAFCFRVAFGASGGSPRIEAFPALDFGSLGSIPLLGPLLFQHDVLTYLALLLAGLSWLFLFRSSYGLSLIAVGQNPAAAETVGIGVARTRCFAVMASGAWSARSRVKMPSAGTGNGSARRRAAS